MIMTIFGYTYHSRKHHIGSTGTWGSTGLSFKLEARARDSGGVKGTPPLDRLKATFRASRTLGISSVT
jgi:hypothetical protein